MTPVPTPAPTRYTVALKPQLSDEEGRPVHGAPIRTAVVEATGDTGASGYPRYAGHGMQADIDPTTHHVEAITVDGRELPYGWVAQVVDVGRPGHQGRDRFD